VKPLDFTIQPLETPTRCQAWFHGAEGQCTRTAEWTVTSRQGEPADLCPDCAAPYRKQLVAQPDPAQQGLRL